MQGYRWCRGPRREWRRGWRLRVPRWTTRPCRRILGRMRLPSPCSAVRPLTSSSPLAQTGRSCSFSSRPGPADPWEGSPPSETTFGRVRRRPLSILCPFPAATRLLHAQRESASAPRYARSKGPNLCAARRTPPPSSCPSPQRYPLPPPAHRLNLHLPRRRLNLRGARSLHPRHSAKATQDCSPRGPLSRRVWHPRQAICPTGGQWSASESYPIPRTSMTCAASYLTWGCLHSKHYFDSKRPRPRAPQDEHHRRNAWNAWKAAEIRACGAQRVRTAQTCFRPREGCSSLTSSWIA
mmetsp:Transcript_61589/g.169305  ORF Transcript_61589/g.169305 Transcript_61589/m.169305 type:complete len:295 (+) Transcript_61589:375-1259(+)